jgi:hypothetical protein
LLVCDCAGFDAVDDDDDLLAGEGGLHAVAVASFFALVSDSGALSEAPAAVAAWAAFNGAVTGHAVAILETWCAFLSGVFDFSSTRGAFALCSVAAAVAALVVGAAGRDFGT